MRRGSGFGSGPGPPVETDSTVQGVSTEFYPADQLAVAIRHWAFSGGNFQFYFTHFFMNK